MSKADGDSVKSKDRESKTEKENVDQDGAAQVKSDTEEPSIEVDDMAIDGVDEESSDAGGSGQQIMSKSPQKRTNHKMKEEDDQIDDDDDEPVRKRTRRNGPKGKQPPLKEETSLASLEEPPKTEAVSSKAGKKEVKSKDSSSKSKSPRKMDTADPKSKRGSKKEVVSNKKPIPAEDEVENDNEPAEKETSDPEDEQSDLEEQDSREVPAREKIQATLKATSKDPYPDWKPGEPVPYAALCTTFSLIEMTTKRLIIMAHCSLFLRQVLRLTPQDLLPTIQLMINKLAADYAGIELGIGESLIMKAIGESTGRSLQIIKADQAEIGDLGLVAAKSRSNQPTMFKPKPLTVRGVLDGLMGIATTSGDGAQARKVAGIKKILSAADTAHAGKGSKGIDITKDKGGASESKFIIRFLEGKLRLGLAEKTVLVSIAHAMVSHEVEKESKKPASSEKLAEGEAILKTVYRYVSRHPTQSFADVILANCQATRL